MTLPDTSFTTIHKTVTVQDDGAITVYQPDLPVGTQVEVLIMIGPEARPTEPEEDLNLLKVAEPSFAFWDNDEDAVYDKL